MLDRLAKELGIPDTLVTTLLDDRTSAEVLDGFLAAHRFRVPIPADTGVERNEAVVSRLWRTRVDQPVLDLARQELWRRTKQSRPARAAAGSTVLRSTYRGARSLVRGLRERLR